MEDVNKNINDLLADFCSGKINDRDLMVLHSWMEESDANRKQANQYLKLYRNYRAYEAMDKIDNDKALGQILNRVKEIKRRRRMVFIRSAAAVAVLLLGSVFVFNYLSKEGEVIEPAPMAQVIEPGEAKATLILGNGSHIYLEEIGDSTVLNESGANIEKNNEVLDYQNSEIEEEVFNTIQIPRGGEYVLVLSDGTKVWLNSDSELTYPVKFLGDKRKVSLKGEGYMKVAKNTAVPFIVEANGTEIEVLGTEFNIKAYADDEQVETTLVEGSVACYKTLDKENAVILQPGSQALSSIESEKIVVKQVDTHIYTSWKDGLFIFDNQTLPELFKTLGRWYDVEVEFENSMMRSLHFSGDLERYENINTHLEMIEMTTDVKFEIIDNTVYVRSR